MLLASSVGSMGTADACLSGLPEPANRSAGQEASTEDAERANRASLLGTEVVVRAVATVQMTPRRKGLRRSLYADRRALGRRRKPQSPHG